ncbi:MAG: molybdopterin dehydrogenase, partial [Dehalococcoidales bacterium]|nr:molybdopterin dehydrogenase [Dehalococcoidales bacterium]
MKTFEHFNANTIEEASMALESENAEAIAGGTDLLGRLKNDVLSSAMYPKTIINLKTISSLSYIKEETGILKIG